jgi:NADPH:quinone reductase
MKAALCKSLDGPSAIEIVELDMPRASAGEVIIRVRMAALNHFDTLITRGKYQHKPELPFSPAGEVAGVVAEVGEDVEGFKPSQRVMAYLGWGGAREFVAVQASAAVPVPESVSDEAASGVSITYGTAIHGLKDRGRLKAGETVAVLGASGGAGLAAIEIAKRMGARVIAAASSPDKLEICRAHGADVLINYDAGDLKAALREATGGSGPEIIYDCVGGCYAEPALRALTWQGRYLVIGFATGEIPKFPLNLLLVKGVEVTGVFWGEAVRRDPASHRANMKDVLGWVAAGELQPRIHAVYPLDQISEAILVLDRREAVGKVVVRV